MRSRAPVALLACLAGLAATPAVAAAADTLEPYKVTVTPSELGVETELDVAGPWEDAKL